MLLIQLEPAHSNATVSPSTNRWDSDKQQGESDLA